MVPLKNIVSGVPCCRCVIPIEKKLGWWYSLRFGMRVLLLYVLFFTNIIYLKYPNFPSNSACYTDCSFAMSIWQCILHSLFIYGWGCAAGTLNPLGCIRQCTATNLLPNSRLGTKNLYHKLPMNLHRTNQFPVKTTKPSDSMPYPGLNCWKILPFKGQPPQVFYITSSTLNFLQVCFRGVPYSWLETCYFHSKLSGPYLNTSPWAPEFTNSCRFLCCVE